MKRSITLLVPALADRDRGLLRRPRRRARRPPPASTPSPAAHRRRIPQQRAFGIGCRHGQGHRPDRHRGGLVHHPPDRGQGRRPRGDAPGRRAPSPCSRRPMRPLPHCRPARSTALLQGSGRSQEGPPVPRRLGCGHRGPGRRAHLGHVGRGIADRHRRQGRNRLPERQRQGRDARRDGVEWRHPRHRPGHPAAGRADPAEPPIPPEGGACLLQAPPSSHEGRHL